MKIIAFIPVRQGSKGIPGKNIKELDGKPLLCWILDTLLKSRIANEVWVATDTAPSITPLPTNNRKARADRRNHMLREFEDKPEFEFHLTEACTHAKGTIGLFRSIFFAHFLIPSFTCLILPSAKKVCRRQNCFIPLDKYGISKSHIAPSVAYNWTDTQETGLYDAVHYRTVAATPESGYTAYRMGGIWKSQES